MPSVRLSNEALSFLKQIKNKNNTQNNRPIVSVVGDDEESDIESEGDETSAVVLTPRLKEHTRRIYNLPSDDASSDGKAIQSAPVSNLSKRFSSTSLNTPSRILQLALEKKPSNEGDDNGRSDKDIGVSDSGTDTEARVSKNEVAAGPSSLTDTNNKRRPLSKKPTREQQNNAQADKQEEFKVPQQSRRKKNTEPSAEKQTVPKKPQPKVVKKRGGRKKKELEQIDVPAKEIYTATDDSEPEEAVVPSIRPKRGRKAKEPLAKAAAPTKSPSGLFGVQVTVENTVTDGVRRDVLLLDDVANSSKNTSNIDDTIDRKIGSVTGNRKSPAVGKDIRNSRKRKNSQEVTEDSEETVGTARTLRGRSNKSETSPMKRSTRNKKARQATFTNSAEKEKKTVRQESSGKPKGDEDASIATNPVIPNFSSDHEEDRSPTSSPSRDSPIITKSNRLSSALVNKSPSYDAASDNDSTVAHRKLSTIPSRSPSSSPDMFTPSPARKIPAKQHDTRASQSAKFTLKLSMLSEKSGTAPRTRRRASIGAAGKASAAAEPPETPTTSDQTTPLQLEAVGLLRKQTPQGALVQTPLRKSLPPTITTPLSSRSRIRIDDELQSEVSHVNTEKLGSLKRNEPVESSKVTPKRQRVQNLSPREVQEAAQEAVSASPMTRRRATSTSPKKIQEFVETQKSPLTRKRARNASPEKMHESASVGTPKSVSKLQQAQTSTWGMQEPRNIHIEETLPSAANMEIENIGISVIPDTREEPQSKQPHSEMTALEQAIAKRTDISGNSSLISTAMQPTRFNAYSASLDDPVRATQLLATDEYRVSWLHILPKCSFYFRVRSPTLIMVVSGIVSVNGDANHSRGLILNSKSRVADLSVGSICQAVNNGELPAIFQVTETLS